MPIDVAIDFGTSKTVLMSGNKILLEQPTVATVNSDEWTPLAFGDKARSMIGRTSDDTETVYPIVHGMIADYDIAEQMMVDYMGRSLEKKLIKPRITVAMPARATSTQRRSAANVAETAGGRRVQVIDSAVAAALGMGIDFSRPGGRMIVDIGAGVTDVATLSAGDIVQCDSAPIGSFDFDEAIIKYVKKEHNILIGNLSAEEIKKQLGSVVPRKEEVIMKAKGRNLYTGLPQIFDITSTDVYNAMKDTAEAICKAIKEVVEKTSPDIVADIMADRVYVTGGGALTEGMSEMLENYLGSKIKIDRDPLHSVAKGAVAAVKYPELLKSTGYQLRNIEDLIVND